MSEYQQRIILCIFWFSVRATIWRLRYGAGSQERKETDSERSLLINPWQCHSHLIQVKVAALVRPCGVRSLINERLKRLVKPSKKTRTTVAGYFPIVRNVFWPGVPSACWRRFLLTEYPLRATSAIYPCQSVLSPSWSVVFNTERGLVVNRQDGRKIKCRSTTQNVF